MIRIRSVAAYEVFQSTPPARGATDILVPGDDTETISIRAPAWGRPLGVDAVVEKGIFQFAPPHGGDTFTGFAPVPDNLFQFAPPHGGDMKVQGLGDINLISIRAPAWGRPLRWFPCPAGSYFNSRPRMGATGCTSSRSWRPRYFNSRPRMGATHHLPAPPLCGLFQFAPPHGGDSSASRGAHTMTISIRAPAWGRRTISPHLLCAVYFNSRPRMGATGDDLKECYACGISIRAPAWGRLIGGPTSDSRPLFQFAPPHGGDSCWRSSQCAGYYFNSRPRMGATGRTSGPASTRHFNSRPRMGATIQPFEDALVTRISIRAPAWGRRSFLCLFCSYSINFNSRPRMGATANSHKSELLRICKTAK